MKNIILDKNIANQIVINNLKRELRTFSKYACLSKSAIRKNVEKIPDKQNIRPAFFHDTDKIIHSCIYAIYR